MRVLIVDDELWARRHLAELLAELRAQGPEVEVVGEAENGLAALELIEQVRPDLVLLDVQMPGLGGFEVIAELKVPAPPLIVFVTAYDRYALQAFEVSAVDFLLKPVEAARLGRALAKVRQQLCSRAPAEFALAELRRLTAALAHRPYPWMRRVLARRGGVRQVLRVEEVRAFVAERETVFAETERGRLVVSHTLRELEEALDPEQFARAHKGAIVNLSHIREIELTGDGGAVTRLEGGLSFIVGRRYAAELKAKLDG